MWPTYAVSARKTQRVDYASREKPHVKIILPVMWFFKDCFYEFANILNSCLKLSSLSRCFSNCGSRVWSLQHILSVDSKSYGKIEPSCKNQGHESLSALLTRLQSLAPVSKLIVEQVEHLVNAIRNQFNFRIFENIGSDVFHGHLNSEDSKNILYYCCSSSRSKFNVSLNIKFNVKQ
jgi:hypothetical protein